MASTFGRVSPATQIGREIPRKIRLLIQQRAQATALRDLDPSSLESAVLEDLAEILKYRDEVSHFDPDGILTDLYLESLKRKRVSRMEDDKLVIHALKIMASGSRHEEVFTALRHYQGRVSAEGWDLAERFSIILAQGEKRLEELRVEVTELAAKRARALLGRPAVVGEIINHDLEQVAADPRYIRLLQSKAIRAHLVQVYLNGANSALQRQRGSKLPGLSNILAGSRALLWEMNLRSCRAVGLVAIDLFRAVSGRLSLTQLQDRYHLHMNPARAACLRGAELVRAEVSPVITGVGNQLRLAISKIRAKRS